MNIPHRFFRKNGATQDKRILITMIIVMAMTLSFATVHAGHSPTGVIYPDVRAPYDQIFQAFTDGVKSSNEGTTLSLKLGKETTSTELSGWISKHKIGGVIALGNRSASLVKQLDTVLRPPTVIGATFLSPSSTLGGISMAPAPKKLFKQLLVLTPKVKTVHVIYTGGEQDWLIAQAQTAASELGLTLHTHVTNDVRELAVSYREVLKNQKRETEALWLPQSGKSLEKAVMNTILSQSWKRHLIIFSSNLADVRKGVLFSRYPNNKLVGKKLFSLLTQLKQNPNEAKDIHLAENLFSALNTRTADHLGLRIKKEDKRKYMLLFPMSK